MIYYLGRHWGSGISHSPLRGFSENNDTVSRRDVETNNFKENMCSTCSGLVPVDKMPVCCLWPEACTLGCYLDLGKLGMPPYPGFMMYNDYGSPPPAHMGIPPVTTDPKTGLPRPPLYAAYPPGQFHHLYSPEFSQWHRPTGYPISSGAFSSSYPPLLNTTISRFGPPGMMPPGIQPGMPHPAIISPGPKQEILPHHMSHDHHRHGSENHHHHQPPPEPEKKKPHIKKPLNAFMLFMKEMRPTVIAECTLRESAAINQILGRRWHALDRSEQSKYYEMARKEKELHLQLYPGWSARDNYAIQSKKKKRKKSDIVDKNRECPNAKKCRARFGMEQQANWCKPCRTMHETCDPTTADLDQSNTNI